MLVDKLSPGNAPFEADGLPTLYGRNGFWRTALPMPRTSTLRRSLDPLPGWRPHDGFAEPGEVPVSFENDDGSPDAPDPVMLRTARWLIGNDAAVERAIVETVLADLPKLREIESQATLGLYEQPLPESWDEPTLRPLIRLTEITLPPVKSRQPYFGAELACGWENEHGYGIMFHGFEVVETGGGDTAHLSWIADRHAEGAGSK